eukprot:754920-Ditylum_brightwellii.AAC.1
MFHVDIRTGQVPTDGATGTTFTGSTYVPNLYPLLDKNEQKSAVLMLLELFNYSHGQNKRLYHVFNCCGDARGDGKYYNRKKQFMQ